MGKLNQSKRNRDMKCYYIFLFLLLCEARVSAQQFSLVFCHKKYDISMNKSYVTQKFYFLNDSDTICMNMRIPFNSEENEINDLGLYYNCHMLKDSTYKFSLEKINSLQIPEWEDSYYKSNVEYNDNDIYKFTEKKQDTSYSSKGYYYLYVDIDNIIYKILSVQPNDNCFYPH